MSAEAWLATAVSVVLLSALATFYVYMALGTEEPSSARVPKAVGLAAVDICLGFVIPIMVVMESKGALVETLPEWGVLPATFALVLACCTALPVGLYFKLRPPGRRDE